MSDEGTMTDASSAAAPAAGAAGDEKASDAEERMRLLQMIKDSSNGPEQAKRRIEQLDKMVSGLKKRRRLCGRRCHGC